MKIRKEDVVIKYQTESGEVFEGSLDDISDELGSEDYLMPEKVICFKQPIVILSLKVLGLEVLPYQKE